MVGWQKKYFSILSGQVISQITSSVLQFAIVWHINALTNSAFALSMAMLIGFLPRALLGSFVGVFIDRFNRKKIMIIADLSIAMVSLLPIFSQLFFQDTPLWIIYLVLFLRAVGSAFHDPTMHAITPQIVPSDQLVRCAGYAQAMESITLIVSPAIAAALYAVWRLNSIVLLDVVGALVAVSILAMVSIPPHKASRSEGGVAEVLRQTAEGFKILRSNNGLFYLVLVSSVYSLAMMPVGALFPFMCTSFFGGTEYHAGLVEVIFAAGLMLGAVVLGVTGGIKNKIYSIIMSCFIMSVSLFTSGILDPNQFVVFVIAAFFMGFSGPFFWGTYRPLLQAGFPEQYLGRIMSLSSSIMVIASPVGMVVSGLFSELFGAEKWFLIASIMTLTCGLICFLNPSIRNAGTIKEGV